MEFKVTDLTGKRKLFALPSDNKKQTFFKFTGRNKPESRKKPVF
jgi:hypothetical protein